jgi:amino acid transporter
MGTFDAFALNVINISYFATGVIFTLQFCAAILPGAQLGVAILLSALFSVGLYLAYAFMSSSYPRAGGDYVYQSRIIHPALAFVATFSAWVFWQLWYQASFTISIESQSFQSLLGVYGWVFNNQALLNGGFWTISAVGSFIIGAALIIISGVLAMLNLRFYVKLQLIMFALSNVSLLVLYFMLLQTTPHSFAANFNSMMNWFNNSNIDWYSKVISDATAAGYTTQAFDWGQTVAAVPIAMTAMGYGFWSIYLSGEIKTARVAKLAAYAIYGSVVFMGIVLALLYQLLQNVGTNFYNSVSYLYIFGGSVIPQIPVTPTYITLAMIADPNPILVAIVSIGSFANVFILMVLINVVVSRVMFAQAMDWVLPQKLAQVGKRLVAPIWGITVVMVGSLIWLVVEVAYPAIAYQFTAVVVGVLLAYILTAVSAIIFPYTQKVAFESSPISKYKLGKVPWVVIFGVVGLVFSIFLLYYYIAIPALGLDSIPSLSIVGGVYVALIIWYYGMKWYRSKHGIDIGLSFKEVPPE